MYVTLRDPTATAADPATDTAVDAADTGAGRGTGRKPTRRGRVRGPRVGSTVVLLGLVSMATDISTESVNAVLPLYLATVLGLGGFAFGLVDAAYQGASALVRVVGGWASDVLDRPKWVAAVGYAGAAVARAFLPFAGGAGSVLTIVTVDRLGKGIRTAPRDAMIAAVTPPAHQGRAFGVHRSLDTLGALIGPVLAFSVLWAVPGGFHEVFVVSSAAGVVGVALLLLAVPDVRPSRWRQRTAPAAVADTAEPPAPRPRPSLRLLADRRLATVVGAAGLLGLTTVSDAFLYLQLADADGLASRWFPLLLVGTNLSYLLLAVPVGGLADRVGRGRVFLVGHVLLVLAYLAAGGPVTGPTATVACLALLGAYYACTDGVLAALAGQCCDARVRASAIATAQTVLALSRAASSVLFGITWATLGRAPALWLFAGALLVVLVPAGLLLRRSARLAGPTAAAARAA